MEDERKREKFEIYEEWKKPRSCLVIAIMTSDSDVTKLLFSLDNDVYVHKL